MKNIIILVAILLIFGKVYAEEKFNCNTIEDYDSKMAHKLVKEQGGLLLDVRTLIENKISSIKGAKRIHVGDLEEEIEQVKKWVGNDMNKPIVVFCAAGVRAARAKKILKKSGFTCVQNLGGISDW
jgi:rhodanese-related sulfurtransferase